MYSNQTTNIAEKRVLLMMPRFFNYHTLLIQEIESRGAVVDFVENKIQAFDGAAPTAKLRSLRHVYRKLINTQWRYASKSIDWSQKYDIFICVNGFSYDKRIINRLKAKNPEVYTVLHLWDSSQMYDWSGIIGDFDKSFSFDPIDAKKFKIDYLADFYPKETAICTESPNIDLFFVGTQHSDRFSVLSKIAPQIDLSQSYIKLLVRYKSLIHSKLLYSLVKNSTGAFAKNYSLNYELYEKKIKAEFLIYDPISPSDIAEKMGRSRCVLDIQAQVQAGLPHQMMTALAMGKKIITTNKWVVNFDFFDPQQIVIIDREKPVVDKEFLEKDYKIDKLHESIQRNRIDNWVDILLQK